MKRTPRTSGRKRPGSGLPAVALAGSLLVAAMAIVVSAPEAEAATTRTLAITSATAHPTVPFGAFDGQAPKVYDINRDGDLEIIAQNDNQWVYVFDSRNGALLAEMKTTFPSGWGARSMNAPEVQVLNGDGKVRLIVGNSAATITSYSYDAAASSSSHFAFKKDWQRRLTDCYSNPGMDSKPVLADLDKDGRLEILAATEELGVFALRDDGSVYWKRCIGGGNASPSVGDLNQDSWPDVVFPSDAGIVTAMNGRTGGTMWTFSAPARFNVGAGSIPVSAAVAQLDGAGGPDVVVGVRDSHDATNIKANHALLVALSSSGGLLWAKQDATGNPLTYTHPVVVDAAKDGQAEVYWADWNTMGHKPGNWEVTGPANFYRYDRAGNLVWKQSLATFWNNKDVPLADVDGDGVQEMLANGPGSNGHDGVWYLDSRNGAKETFIDIWPYKLNRAPVVADLYGNGRMQWVAQVGPYASDAGHGIVIYDTGSAYNSAWPHLPYPPKGSGSAGTTSSSGTTTSTGGAFSASFTGVRGNEWWVQAMVGTNGPALSKVDVRLNGGAWQPLTKQSWGGWAASYHIVQGTIVQLRATATDGQTNLSGCRQWIPPANQDAAIVACGTTTTTGGAFSATFKPVAVGNDWWVEVAVTANQPVVKVEAKINSGAWVTLDKKDWGTWAKSIYTPNGSVVTFRATNGSGAIVTSGPTTWT